MLLVMGKSGCDEGFDLGVALRGYVQRGVGGGFVVGFVVGRL